MHTHKHTHTERYADSKTYRLTDMQYIHTSTKTHTRIYTQTCAYNPGKHRQYGRRQLGTRAGTNIIQLHNDTWICAHLIDRNTVTLTYIPLAMYRQDRCGHPETHAHQTQARSLASSGVKGMEEAPPPWHRLHPLQTAAFTPRQKTSSWHYSLFVPKSNASAVRTCGHSWFDAECGYISILKIYLAALSSSCLSPIYQSKGNSWHKSPLPPRWRHQADKDTSWISTY